MSILVRQSVTSAPATNWRLEAAQNVSALPRVFQALTCSAIASAPSLMPRYLTVLSILVNPATVTRFKVTAGRQPVLAHLRLRGRFATSSTKLFGGCFICARGTAKLEYLCMISEASPDRLPRRSWR
jgi:hypothetical protein